MLQPLDGPSKHGILTVTDTVPIEVKVGASSLEERKVITMQSYKSDDPDFGDFYVYFAEGTETPTNTDLSTKGVIQPKNNLHTYEASAKQIMWVMAVTVSSIKIRIIERA